MTISPSAGASVNPLSFRSISPENTKIVSSRQTHHGAEATRDTQKHDPVNLAHAQVPPSRGSIIDELV